MVGSGGGLGDRDALRGLCVIVLSVCVGDAVMPVIVCVHVFVWEGGHVGVLVCVIALWDLSKPWYLFKGFL